MATMSEKKQTNSHGFCTNTPTYNSPSKEGIRNSKTYPSPSGERTSFVSLNQPIITNRSHGLNPDCIY